PFIVSAWVCASRPRPSRYIETMVTSTTETVIDRLRRMPVQISWRRKRGLMVLGQPRVGVGEVKLGAGRSGAGRDDAGIDEGVTGSAGRRCRARRRARPCPR